MRHDHNRIPVKKALGYAPLRCCPTLVFLQMNGYNVEFTNEQLIDFGLDVAKSEFDQPKIANWIKLHHVQPSFDKVKLKTNANAAMI